MKSNKQLERRFAPTNDKELSDPDYPTIFGNEPEGIKKWDEVLRASPTVVLAEGRGGKTYEFKLQVEKLKSEGKVAFFIPLERLHDEDLEEAIEIDDIEAFQNWHTTFDTEAYFFLDALDELKLREGTFRKALRKVARAIGSNTNRANIVISCRPADWKTNIDAHELAKFCTGRVKRAEKPSDDPEALFLEIISKEDLPPKEEENDQAIFETVDRSKVQVVSLLSLSQKEVKKFAEIHEADYAQNFIEHLEKNDLWHLYRLPAEILDGLDQLKAGKPLGQLEEQVAFGIEKKLTETQNNKPNTLSLDKAKEGSERLALALFLLKHRSFKVDSDENNDALKVSHILTDWSQAEQQELIGRPLFDPSGVGAVRFHHRSSQEYLAAKRLQQLRQNGMAPREFLELIFSEVGDERVVKPSMAPVAAWLSLWEPAVCKEVLNREPALLFMQGLPSALPIGLRKKILEAYVKKFANKDWCQTGVDRSNLRRVSSPELASTIRKLWDEAYTGYDSRELLLDFIWAGEISECADLSLHAALDESIGSSHQIYSAWGVLSAGSHNQKQNLAQHLIEGGFNERIMRNILPQLVSKAIPTEQAFDIIEKMEATDDDVHGLNYTIYQISKNKEINRDHLIDFRNKLSGAVWRGRSDNIKTYNARSAKDHYQDGLLAACAETIPEKSDELHDWAWSFAIAEHFGERQSSIIAKDETEKSWAAVQSNSALREQYFWACLKMSDTLDGVEDDRARFIGAIRDFRRSLQIGKEDKDWLLRELSKPADLNNRGVVFEAIIYFFNLQEDTNFRLRVKEVIMDRPEWLERVNVIEIPKPRQPSDWEIEDDKRKIKFEQKEKERISDWQSWRMEVLADKNFLMGSDSRLGTLYDAQKIISQAKRDHGSWGKWDATVIEDTMGSGFLGRYREELSKFWRETEVQLPSERPIDKRNTTYNNWLLALVGVKAESELPNWAENLSTEEAKRATRISFIELNGFGSFFPELDRVHPEIVGEIIASEATSQLKQLSDTSRADIFHDVYFHGSNNMKRALAYAIAPRLMEPSFANTDNISNVLDYAVRIIASHGTGDNIKSAIKVFL